MKISLNILLFFLLIKNIKATEKPIENTISLSPCSRYNQNFEDANSLINFPLNAYYAIFLTCYFRQIGVNNNYHNNIGMKLQDYNRNAHHPAKNIKIPTIIQYIWIFSTNKFKAESMPIKFCELIQENFKNFPEFSINLWTNDKFNFERLNSDCLPTGTKILSIFEDLNSLWKQNYFLFQAIQQFIDYGIFTAAVEIVKPMILENQGGIILSGGIKLLNEIIDYHRIFDFYAGAHFDLGMVVGSFVGAKPHHPILQHCLEILRETFQLQTIKNYLVKTSDLVETLFQLTMTIGFVRFGNKHLNDDYLFHIYTMKLGIDHYDDIKNLKINVNNQSMVIKPIGQVYLYGVGRKENTEKNQNVLKISFYFNNFIHMIYENYYLSLNYRKKATGIKKYQNVILKLIINLVILCGVFIVLTKYFKDIFIERPKIVENVNLNV